jgi:hypothetical protein
MRHQHISKVIVLAACGVVTSVVLAAQSQDCYALKAPNGIAFSQFTAFARR